MLSGKKGGKSSLDAGAQRGRSAEWKSGQYRARLSTVLRSRGTGRLRIRNPESTRGPPGRPRPHDPAAEASFPPFGCAKLFLPSGPHAAVLPPAMPLYQTFTCLSRSHLSLRSQLQYQLLSGYPSARGYPAPTTVADTLPQQTGQFMITCLPANDPSPPLDSRGQGLCLPCSLATTTATESDR